MIETSALIAVTLLATLGLGFCLGVMSNLIEVEEVSSVEFMEKVGKKDE